MDMEKLISWCEENGYDAGTREGQKAFEAAHSGGGGKTGRKNKTRVVTVRCFGRNEGDDAVALYASATGVNYRDRHAQAQVLTWQARTAGGFDVAHCEVCEEIELS